jgi:hypothetical protein
MVEPQSGKEVARGGGGRGRVLKMSEKASVFNQLVEWEGLDSN